MTDLLIDDASCPKVTEISFCVISTGSMTAACLKIDFRVSQNKHLERYAIFC